MFVEISQLPQVVQQQIIQKKMPVDIINNGKVVATVNPTVAKILNNTNDYPISAYDYVMSLDMDERLADIEFDLPPRNKTLYPPEVLD
ncbi:MULTISPECIES: hypothetical protein [unclassified Moraxella]|uniref:hypothetical protein n=1 Tax=unclassified Moraxella TaxID=2685852 RepID=UPI003AF73CAC